MTQQEHLQLIRTKCVELLELAKQRTPGRWTVANGCKTPIQCGEKHIAMVNYYKSGIPETDVFGDEHDANAALIASAAGPFEAALASTVAAIDDSAWQPAPDGYCHPDNPWGVENTTLIQQIITSWPLELLRITEEQKPSNKQQPGWQKIPQ